MERERSGLLETTERKQKLRSGAPEKSEEALFDMVVLDDVISEMQGKTCGEVRWNGKGSKPKSGVTWKAAPGPQT